MSFWARVLPDKLGRPTTVRVSARLAKAIGTQAFTLEREKDHLILELNGLEGEYKLTAAKAFGAGRLLDECSQVKQLEPRPFVVKKDGSAFIFDLWKYDDQLPTTAQRLASAPMKFVPVRKMHKNVLSMEHFIRLFALVYLVSPFTESDVTLEPPKRTGDFLPMLPAFDSIKARFGGWHRFKQFLDYKVLQYQAQSLTQDQIKSSIADILEVADG